MPACEYHLVADGQHQIKIAIAVEVSALEQIAGPHPAGIEARRRASVQHRAVTLSQNIAVAPWSCWYRRWSWSLATRRLPLRSHELREAIERPAELAGRVFEPGLVERILHDAGRQMRTSAMRPRTRPLVAHVLHTLHEQAAGRSLTPRRTSPLAAAPMPGVAIAEALDDTWVLGDGHDGLCVAGIAARTKIAKGERLSCKL